MQAKDLITEVNSKALNIVTKPTTHKTPFIFTPRFIWVFAKTVAIANTIVTLATSEPCKDIPNTEIVRFAPLIVSPQKRMLTRRTIVKGIIR